MAFYTTASLMGRLCNGRLNSETAVRRLQEFNFNLNPEVTKISVGASNSIKLYRK
jgi:hypothetical protein